MSSRGFLIAICCVLWLASGCDEDTPAGPNLDAGWPTDDGGTIAELDGGVTITEDGGGTWICKKTTCNGQLLQCGDCIDNDGDGKVDSRDPGCDGPCDNTEAGWTPDDSGVVQVGDGSVVIAEDGGVKWVCHLTTCAGKLLECGDCIDNDGDGKVDWKDLECLGPCDNTEGPALIGGIGGGTSSNCKVDCYFDYGNGSGWDDCIWDHKCDPLEPEQAWGCIYDSSMVGTKKCPVTQSAECGQKCLPFTPNGCDCFGCCTFPALAGKGPGGSDGYVWIGAMDSTTKQGTCTFEDILDTAKCPRCTPIMGCHNACGKCEICIGKPTLPPECYQKPDGGVGDGGGAADGGVPPLEQCPGGQQPCGLPGQALCQQGTYCISGCCIKLVIE